MANYAQPITDVHDLQTFIERVNDRFRRLDAAVSGALVLTADLDAGGHRIVNLANPQGLNDAINQASARRLVGRGGGTGSGTNTTTERVITETRVLGGGGATPQAVFRRTWPQLTALLDVTEAEVPTDEKLLVTAIQQGAATAYAVTFNAANFSATSSAIPPTLGKWNYWIHAGNTATGLWDMVSHPLMEMTL
jgi:hypothetical protein